VTSRSQSVIFFLIFSTIFSLSARALDDTGAAPQEFVEITPRLEESVEKALAWLAKTQSREGCWSSEAGGQGQYPMAMTGLAGLAFLSAGHTPERGKYGPNLLRAIEYCLKHQSNDGLIDSGQDGQQMYGHGFAMTFLGEAYGMCPAETNARIKAALTKAVRKTQQSQSVNGGWYYSPNSGADEGSVTVTQVQGLRSARNVGIDVPEKVMKSAIEYLHKSQNADGGIRYQVTSGGTSSPALTAAGAEVFMMAGQYRAKEAEKACEYLKKNLDPRKTQGYHDMYTNFYGSQAMFQIGGEYWNHYFALIRDRLLSSQASEGCWRGDVGTTYSTAIGVLILCLPFRYLPIYQR
jgi:squalene cyclase